MIFLTALFNYVLSLSIEKSVLFAAILSAVLALTRTKLAEEGEKKRRTYSIKHALAELIVAFGAFSALHLAGLKLQAAISGGLFFVILAEIYYAFRRYGFPKAVMAARRIALFTSSAMNCYTFVVQSAAFSILVGLLMTLAVESEYLVNGKLLEKGLVSIKDLERGARLVIIAPSAGIGAVIGSIAVGISTGMYDVAKLSDDLHAFFRAAFLLVVIFIPLGSLMGWARLFLEHGKKEVVDR